MAITLFALVLHAFSAVYSVSLSYGRAAERAAFANNALVVENGGKYSSV